MSSDLSSPAAGTNDKVCYLLDKMPAEIRNTIWELSFVEDAWVYLLDAKIREPLPSHDLLATCKQINKEAKGLYSRAQQRYWQDTAFKGLSREDKNAFDQTRELIKSIAAEDFNKIQHLCFVHDTYDSPTVFTLMFAKGGGWKAEQAGDFQFTRMVPATDSTPDRIDIFDSKSELKEACENAPASYSPQEQALTCVDDIEHFWYGF